MSTASCLLSLIAWLPEQADGMVPSAGLQFCGAVEHGCRAAGHRHRLPVRVHVLLHLQGGGTPAGMLCHYQGILEHVTHPLLR